MSEGAHVALSVALGGLFAVAAVLLYVWLVVRPQLVKAARAAAQMDNPPPAAFPFVEDAEGDLWESLGGGMWACWGEAHIGPSKPKRPIWLPWHNLIRWYGPVRWLRFDEVATRRKSA